MRREIKIGRESRTNLGVPGLGGTIPVNTLFLLPSPAFRRVQAYMGCLPLTLRTFWLLAGAGLVLPMIREVARETLSEARKQYAAGQPDQTPQPPVTWLDPAVLTRLVPFVATGRLLRRLVTARPMGP